MTRTGFAARGPKSRKRQVLPVVAGLLIASGLVRFGGETGLVLAEENEFETGASEPTLASDGIDGPEALVAALQDRERTLAAREVQLEDRIRALTVAETEISEKIRALEEAESTLRATMEIAQTAAEDDLIRLTAVYENMKPANAAALFTEMDPAFAAGFLGLMRAEAAAAIMSNLSPATAYSISVLLAGRNAEAPTE
jgi:flagellar motility protein MotE (MotC chaperone)